MIESVLFDLDETLYPRNIGLMQAIGQRIHEYMEDRLGMESEVALRLRKEYYRKYGTSLRGLQVHYGVDPEDYLEFVHDIKLSDYIEPNPALKVMLDGIRARKIIFTNATIEHARGVTGVLGIEGCFERVIDVRSNNYVGKPHPAVYRHVVDLIGIPAQRCLLIEDNVRNLRPAKNLGMGTVLVGDQESADAAVDFHLPDVLGVENIVRRLQAGDGQRAVT